MTTLALHSTHEATIPPLAAAHASRVGLVDSVMPPASAPVGSNLPYERAKRAIDVCLAIALLLAAVPLMLVIACAICLDSPGPAVFRQVRTGKGGRRFVLHKFRTMRQDPVGSPYRCQLRRPVPKSPADPRVTRVGRVLRTWSLDELPNLWAVIRGDMSLVGPRPTSWGTDGYEPWQLRRLDVIPGVVGLPEVMGRSTLDFNTRVKLDLEYIGHRSLRKDLHILLLTVRAVVSRVGAY